MDAMSESAEASGAFSDDDDQPIAGFQRSTQSMGPMTNDDPGPRSRDPMGH
jgi:hypothetical protein